MRLKSAIRLIVLCSDLQAGRSGRSQEQTRLCDDAGHSWLTLIFGVLGVQIMRCAVLLLCSRQLDTVPAAGMVGECGIAPENDPLFACHVDQQLPLQQIKSAPAAHHVDCLQAPDLQFLLKPIPKRHCIRSLPVITPMQLFFAPCTTLGAGSHLKSECLASAYM